MSVVHVHEYDTHSTHTLAYTSVCLLLYPFMSVMLIHECDAHSWVWCPFMSVMPIHECDAHSWVWCSFMRVMLIQHTLLYTRVCAYCEIHSCVWCSFMSVMPIHESDAHSTHTLVHTSACLLWNSFMWCSFTCVPCTRDTHSCRSAKETYNDILKERTNHRHPIPEVV